MASSVRADSVAEAIREVSAEVIMPRFRALGPGDVMEKNPGDLVTVADQLAEQHDESVLTLTRVGCYR
jgi:fructose-1,6-bisphosphatase/inositol monophosphatase family enzyme